MDRVTIRRPGEPAPGRARWRGVACLALLLTACGGGDKEVTEAPPPAPTEWGYGIDNGPARWADLRPEYALCGSGTRQSPVDLGAATPADLPDVDLEYRSVPLEVFNDGRTAGAHFTRNSFLEVGGSIFDLEELHFHLPSEHRVDGRSFPAEMHFVHQNGYGELAVVAVLVEKGAELPALAPFLAHLPRQASDSPQPVAGATLNLPALLPEQKLDYRYAGSLTTPPCTEKVRWYVLRSPVSCSAAQLAALREVVRGNNRPVQDRNGRTVAMDAFATDLESE
jgi:carbonic anhydrase